MWAKGHGTEAGIFNYKCDGKPSKRAIRPA